MSRKISGFCSLTSTHDPVSDWLTRALRGKCGHQPLQKARDETQAESELVLKSKHPCVTSSVELVTRLWCAGAHRTQVTPWTWASLGFLGSWLSQYAQTLTSVTYIFNRTFFYLFLTLGTQWVRDLIPRHYRGFQARSEVCPSIHYSIRADMLMSLW